MQKSTCTAYMNVEMSFIQLQSPESGKSATL